jgi:hypothetical protein
VSSSADDAAQLGGRRARGVFVGVLFDAAQALVEDGSLDWRLVLHELQDYADGVPGALFVLVFQQLDLRHLFPRHVELVFPEVVRGLGNRAASLAEDQSVEQALSQQLAIVQRGLRPA